MKVTDPDNGSNQVVLKYGASAAISSSAISMSGKADASTAIALDDNYMIVADDEEDIRRACGEGCRRANDGEREVASEVADVHARKDESREIRTREQIRRSDSLDEMRSASEHA